MIKAKIQLNILTKVIVVVVILSAPLVFGELASSIIPTQSEVEGEESQTGDSSASPQNDTSTTTEPVIAGETDETNWTDETDTTNTTNETATSTDSTIE